MWDRDWTFEFTRSFDTECVRVTVYSEVLLVRGK